MGYHACLRSFLAWFVCLCYILFSYWFPFVNYILCSCVYRFVWSFVSALISLLFLRFQALSAHRREATRSFRWWCPLPECGFTCVLLEFLFYHFDPVLLCVCASTSDWLVFMCLPLRLLVSCPLLVSLSPDYPVYPLHTVWFQLSCLLHVEPTCFS